MIRKEGSVHHGYYGERGIPREFTKVPIGFYRPREST